MRAPRRAEHPATISADAGVPIPSTDELSTAVRPAPPPEPASAVSEPVQSPAEGFATRLGGVLYLIHPLVHLELLDAFERELDGAASAWGLLELLARELLATDELDDDPLWTALAELDGRLPGAPPDPAVRDWLTPRVPGVRQRLEEALGDGVSVGDLLRVAGRIYVTATHVDLVAGLDAVSLPARIAGLDRDPGWVPALGRVVHFHFESTRHFE